MSRKYFKLLLYLLFHKFVGCHPDILSCRMIVRCSNLYRLCWYGSWACSYRWWGISKETNYPNMSTVTTFNRSTMVCLNYVSIDSHVVITVKIQDFGKSVSLFEVYRPTFYIMFELTGVKLIHRKITNPVEIEICSIQLLGVGLPVHLEELFFISDIFIYLNILK